MDPERSGVAGPLRWDPSRQAARGGSKIAHDASRANHPPPLWGLAGVPRTPVWPSRSSHAGTLLRSHAGSHSAAPRGGQGRGRGSRRERLRGSRIASDVRADRFPRCHSRCHLLLSAGLTASPVVAASGNTNPRLGRGDPCYVECYAVTERDSSTAPWKNSKSGAAEAAWGFDSPSRHHVLR
jgi:hypothetical protein